MANWVSFIKVSDGEPKLFNLDQCLSIEEVTPAGGDPHLIIDDFHYVEGTLREIALRLGTVVG